MPLSLSLSRTYKHKQVFALMIAEYHKWIPLSISLSDSLSLYLSLFLFCCLCLIKISGSSTITTTTIHQIPKARLLGFVDSEPWLEVFIMTKLALFLGFT